VTHLCDYVHMPASKHLSYSNLRDGARPQPGDTADIWWNGEDATVTVQSVTDGAIVVALRSGFLIRYDDVEDV
jgi:hypothetical protein